MNAPESQPLERAAPPARRSRAGAAWIALVMAAAALAFAPALRDEYILDDTAQAKNLALPRGAAGWIKAAAQPWWTPDKKKSLWRPVTRLAILAEKRVGAEGPVPLHAASIALHAFGCALALLLARSLGLGLAGAGAAGLLLAVHPLRSEGVHQIVGQAEILAAIFMTGGLLAHARMRRRGGGWRAISAVQFLFYALALGAKEHAAIYPLFLLLLEADGFFRLRRSALQADASRKTEPGDHSIANRPGAASFRPLPFRHALYIAAALAAALDLFLIAKFWITGGILEPKFFIPDFENPLARMGFADRLPAALGIFGYALLKLFLPFRLSPDYSAESLPLSIGWAWPMSWLGAAAALAIVVGAAISFRRRGRAWALAAAGMAAYGFTSNLILVIGVAAALRLWYFPIIAPAIAAGWLWERWDARARASTRGALACLAPRLALAAAALLLASACWSFAPAWRTNILFAERTIERFPRCWRAHHNLATQLYGEKDFEAAAKQAKLAIQIRPIAALSHDVFGLSAMYLPGNEEEAERAFRRALKLQPGLSLVHKHLGNFLLMRKRPNEALPCFEAYLKTKPTDADSINKKIDAIRSGAAR